jgi:hypothetical protein
VDDWTPREAALTIPCARCEAKVGVRCTTITGRPTDVHMARVQPLTEAYAAGYDDHDPENFS